MQHGLETKSLKFVPMMLVTVQAPPEDVERLMDAVTRVTPLAMGAYDHNAFQFAGGVERYRPLEGAAAGPRRRHGNGRASSKSPSICQTISAFWRRSWRRSSTSAAIWNRS